MNKFIKTVILGIVLSISQAGYALLVNPTNPYYGESFYKVLGTPGINHHDVLNEVKKVLQSSHVHETQGFDQLVGNCADSSVGQNNQKSHQGPCDETRSVGYDEARRIIFGQLDLRQKGDTYYVKDVYCNQEISSEHYHGIGPDKIPMSTIMNVEHTWPQSKFSGKHSKGAQKSDLHHLYPTDSQMNSIRGNYNFGEVAEVTQRMKCNDSRFGRSASGKGHVFEPPQEHKGNVARAIFYFASKYDMKMDNDQEVTLKKWNQQDPVDQEEKNRNEAIYQIQKNRNPYVDHPELVDQVSF
jgi:endonuclease I